MLLCNCVVTYQIKMLSLRQNSLTNLLPVGSMHEVFIINVDDGPRSFTVQLQHFREKVLPKIDSFFFKTLPKPCNGVLVPGLLVIARSSINQKFSRALITSLRLSTSCCRVYHLDYGITENISTKDIYELPEEVNDLAPPQAMNFSLAYIKNKNINESSKDIFTNLIKNKKVKLIVLQNEIGSFSQCCDLYLDGKNIREEWLNLTIPKEYFIQPLNRCQEVDVTVSFIESPSKFFVNILSDENILENIQESLAVFCPAQPEIQDVNNVIIGTPIGSLYSYDNEWYRAIVTGIICDNTLNVFYVDFGNRESVRVDRICNLNQKLVTQWPCQAIECCLIGFENTPYNSFLAHELKNKILGRHFRLKLHFLAGSNRLVVDLIDANGNAIAPIMKNLIKTTLSDSSSAMCSTPCQSNKDITCRVVTQLGDDVQRVHIDGRYTCSKRRDIVKLVSLANSENTFKYKQDNIRSDRSYFRNNRSQSADFKITNHKNDRTFYNSMQKRANKMNDSKDENNSTNSSEQLYEEKQNLENNEKKANLYYNHNRRFQRSYNNNYGRARTERKAEFKQVQVGVDSSYREQSSFVVKYEKTGRNQRECADNKNCNVSNRYLYREDRRFVARRGPNWQKRRVPTLSPTYIWSSLLSPQNDSSLSTDSVIMDMPQSKDSSGSNIEESDKEAVKLVIPHKKVEIGDEFPIYLSVIGSGPNEIYVHLAGCEPALKELHERIDAIYPSEFTDHDKQLSKESLSPGLYVVAKFPDDSQFYRACVTSVQDSMIATVLYIDYGNIAHVPYSDIYALSPQLTDIPVQAMRVMLSDLEPLKDSWRIDQFKYSSISEEDVLLMKVNNLHFIDGESIVEGSLAYNDGRTLSQRLIEDGLAVSKK